MSGIRLLLIFRVHSKKLVTPRCKYLATRQGFVFAGNLDDVQMWRQQTKYGINGLLTTHLAKICSWHSFDEHLGANYSSRLNAHRNTWNEYFWRTVLIFLVRVCICGRCQKDRWASCIRCDQARSGGSELLFSAPGGSWSLSSSPWPETQHQTFSFLGAPQNILRMAGADEAELKEVLREWEEKKKPFLKQYCPLLSWKNEQDYFLLEITRK